MILTSILFCSKYYVQKTYPTQLNVDVMQNGPQINVIT